MTLAKLPLSLSVRQTNDRKEHAADVNPNFRRLTDPYEIADGLFMRFLKYRLAEIPGGEPNGYDLPSHGGDSPETNYYNFFGLFLRIVPRSSRGTLPIEENLIPRLPETQRKNIERIISSLHPNQVHEIGGLAGSEDDMEKVKRFPLNAIYNAFTSLNSELCLWSLHPRHAEFYDDLICCTVLGNRECVDALGRPARLVYTTHEQFQEQFGITRSDLSLLRTA